MMGELLSSLLVLDRIDNPELQTLVLVVFDDVGDDLQQQRLADSSRCYVSADILHLANELSGAVQIAVLQQHLGVSVNSFL